MSLRDGKTALFSKITHFFARSDGSSPEPAPAELVEARAGPAFL